MIAAQDIRTLLIGCGKLLSSRWRASGCQCQTLLGSMRLSAACTIRLTGRRADLHIPPVFISLCWHVKMTSDGFKSPLTADTGRLRDTLRSHAQLFFFFFSFKTSLQHPLTNQLPIFPPTCFLVFKINAYKSRAVCKKATLGPFLLVCAESCGIPLAPAICL